MSVKTSPRGRVRIRTAVIAAATVAAGFLPLANAHAVDPGKNGSIAFVTFDEFTGHASIATEYRDGSNFKHIVNDDNASSPAWSPDGKLIAYGTSGGVDIIKPDGTFVRSVAPNGGSPTWSRDGSQIAFAVGNSLYRQSATGGTVTRLTTAPKGCRDQGPRWSPTAPSVVFRRYCTASAPHSRIYTVNTSTKALHFVTADGKIDKRDLVDSPDFLPNGKRIVLTALCSAAGQCIHGNNRIVTVNLNGGQRVTITHDPSCGPQEDCYPNNSVKASPDGNDYLYTFTTNAPSCFAAVHAKATFCGDEGSGVDALQPDWQPLP